jgi:hypothetical protein
MSKRLAITIAGAVSLGSYEAGVLYEILAAIAAHNTDVRTTPEEKIYIDIITGASAGGMSSAILAQKLLFEGTSLAGQDSNALHDPWINEISLDQLLNHTSGDNPTHSVFSSQLIEKISRKYITSRYGNGPPPAPSPHPAIDRTKPLKLGLALSNLDGIDYAKDLRTGGQFVYTRYQDELRRDFSLNPASDDPTLWEGVRNAAVACGAFPFAFAVKALQRTLAEYVEPVPSGFPPLNLRFAYTDGGVFQNEPLGMAKKFVDQIDRHLDTENRFYLFIAPGAKDSTIATGPGAPITDKTANFYQTAETLIEAIFYQARFQDWIMAEEVNLSVKVFNLRARQLMEELLNGSTTGSVIESAADSFLKVLEANAPTRITQQIIDDALERLRSQFSDEYARLHGPEVPLGTATAWLKAIFVLELSAELELYDEMNIFGITALNTELAGSSLIAFAGFFDQKIRQHDYDVGRNKAKSFILAQNAAPQGGLGPFRYDPGPPIYVDPAYANFDPSKLSKNERKVLLDRLASRADTLLQEAGVPGIIRWAAGLFYIRPMLRKWLSL